jgi:protein-disulfide isomerase
MRTLRPLVHPNDHHQGEISAAAQLVEYGDYGSASCAALLPVIRQLQHYFDPDLCFVFRHFPQSDLHPIAEIAAETVEFAGSHDLFWEMHELVLTRQETLDRMSLIGYTAQLDLSPAALETAWADRSYQPRIQRDVGSGLLSGVVETPAIFVNGHAFTDELDFDALAIAIEEALAAA